MTDTVPTTSFSVLLVEDQADVAESLRMYLQLACGYTVTLARDGEAGIEAAIREQPDAIVCDIGLPKQDGFDVAVEVTRSLPRKPVLVAVSGYSRADYVERARAVSFDCYMIKPAEPAALVDALWGRGAVPFPTLD